MTGQATVYGRVLQLNAVNVATGNNHGTGTFVTHAGVEVNLVNMSEEMICTLGRHLMQRIEIRGLATWNTSSWEMTQLRPQHVRLHDRRFLDVIRNIRNVSEDLVGLDVEAALAELRGHDGAR